MLFNANKGRKRERGVKEEKRIILIKWKSLANRQQSESVMYRRWGVYVAWFGVCECWLPSLNVIGGLVHILRIVWMLRIVCKRENKWKQLPVENIAVIDKWLEMSFPHWELIRTKKYHKNTIKKWKGKENNGRTMILFRIIAFISTAKMSSSQ